MGKEGNGCDAELLSMKEREGKGREGEGWCSAARWRGRVFPL
jgi:hypothetical protein